MLLTQLLACSFAADVACIYTNPAPPLGYTCTMRFLAYSRDLDSLNVTGAHLAGKTHDDVNRVYITQSGILYVPSPMFGIFKNLQWVEIENAGLQRLNENSFNNATKLKKFVSYRNKVATLGARAFFAAGESLEEILLSTNTITEMDSKAFLGLKSLKQLFILDNAIVSIAPGTFDSLNRLEILNLGYNGLTELESETFSGLENLRELYLFWNKFTAIKAEVFKNLPSLEILYLHSNPLVEVYPNAFLGLTAVKELHLDNNAIKNLEEGSFSGLDSLEKLLLSGNQLETFTASMWSGLENLRELQLQLMAMKTFDGRIFETLKSLENLLMNSMEIAEIRSEAFEGKMSTSNEKHLEHR